VLPGLLALSFVFYLLYGPLEVALPVHVATDLHGSAALLGTFWAVFGVGAIIGELAAPYLRRWRVWPTMTGIVLGWGLALVPLGLVTPLWTGLAAFFAGAVIWGPWMSLSMGVLQDASPPGALAQVIAARSRARSGNHRSFGRNPYIARMRAPSGSAGYGMRFASGG
jgi:DHA3 family macrolide efflux protein-like MFS transporter